MDARQFFILKKNASAETQGPHAQLSHAQLFATVVDCVTVNALNILMCC